MNISKIVKFLVLAVLILLAGCGQPRVQSGDLLFVGIPVDYSLEASSMDNAIVSATGDSNQINYIHVAILEVEDGQTWVIDATVKHGVDRHPLDTFLADFTLKDGSLPLLDVRRVKISLRNRFKQPWKGRKVLSANPMTMLFCLTTIPFIVPNWCRKVIWICMAARYLPPIL